MYFSEPSLPSVKSVFYVGKGKGSRWTDHVMQLLFQKKGTMPDEH